MQTGDCTFDEVRNTIHYLRLEQHITAEFIMRRDKRQYFCHSNSNDNNISIISMIRALVKKEEKRSLYCCSEKIWISSCNYISATFLVLNREAKTKKDLSKVHTKILAIYRKCHCCHCKIVTLHFYTHHDRPFSWIFKRKELKYQNTPGFPT